MYTPGAGTLPPVLAGRDVLLHRLQVGLNDVAVTGRARAQDVILVGPRGVGKTVTLTTYGRGAVVSGFEVVNLQAVAGHAGLVESLLQRAAIRIDKQAGPWQRAKHAFDRIAGISLGVAGVSAMLSTRPAEASARLDPGTLAEALVELATEVRRDNDGGGLLVTVDEMQVTSAADLALLAATLHRLNVDHPAAPVVFAGTGLPHVPSVLRSAGVTHPDRLFVRRIFPSRSRLLTPPTRSSSPPAASASAGTQTPRPRSSPPATATRPTCNCSPTRCGSTPQGRTPSRPQTPRPASRSPSPSSPGAPSGHAGTACPTGRWNTSPPSPSTTAEPPAGR